MKNLIILIILISFNTFAQESQEKQEYKDALGLVGAESAENWVENELAKKEQREKEEQSAYNVAMPDYCKENYLAPSCISTDINLTDESLGGVLEVSKNLSEYQFRENLKRTAIVKLMEEKKSLLLAFPDLYKRENSNYPFYYEGFSKPENYTGSQMGYFSGSSVGYTPLPKVPYQESCFKNDPKLKSKLDNMESSFDKDREKTLADERQVDILTDMLLGAVAAEEGIEQRPQLSKKIKSLEQKIEHLEDTVKNGVNGKVYYGRGITASSSPCYKGAMSFNAKKCQEFKLKLKNAPEELNKLQAELNSYNFKRDEFDRLIFNNQFYVEPNGARQKTGNWFANVFRSEENDVLMGNFRKSRFLEEGLKNLKNTIGPEEYENLKNLLSPENNKEKAEISGQALAFTGLRELLLNKEELYKKTKDLFQGEIVQQVHETNKTMKEICKSNGEDLHQYPQVLSTAKAEYLEVLKEDFGEGENLNAYLGPYHKAHCSILKKHKDSQWFKNRFWGIDGKMASGVGLGLTSLGLGIAAVGCPPCAAIAIPVGLLGAGVSVSDALDSQRKYNTARGLANVKLADQKDLRNLYSEAQLAWGFVGVEVAFAPFGMKMLKSTKLMTTGKKALSKASDLGKNKKFFNTMVSVLEEDDYLKVIKSIEELPVDVQAKIADQLKGLKDIKGKPLRYTMISKVLEENNIKLPSSKELNNLTLKKLEADPEEIKKLKNEYASEYEDLSIVAGTPDEKAFLRVAGILKRKWCVGFCTKFASKEKVMDEYRKLMRSCRG